jgi:hypothetical protein
VNLQYLSDVLRFKLWTCKWKCERKTFVRPCLLGSRLHCLTTCLQFCCKQIWEKCCNAITDVLIVSCIHYNLTVKTSLVTSCHLLRFALYPTSVFLNNCNEKPWSWKNIHNCAILCTENKQVHTQTIIACILQRYYFMVAFGLRMEEWRATVVVHISKGVLTTNFLTQSLTKLSLSKWQMKLKCRKFKILKSCPCAWAPHNGDVWRSGSNAPRILSALDGGDSAPQRTSGLGGDTNIFCQG